MEDRYHDYSFYGLEPFPFTTHPNFSTEDGLPRTNAVWYAHLKEELRFPFNIRYVEGRTLPYRSEATITGLYECTDRYGIMVNGRMPGRDGFVAPLADMEGFDANKQSAKLLEWYRIWFANR